MAKIKVLPQAVADKIAAGEVAERPAAVVKELVENSIDAGADRICVEIKKGGIAYISVEDNGKGIPYDEVEFAFVRHATSKLRDIDDLFSIETMGFRGEALASICAVSDVEVITKERNALEGAHVTVKHGKVSQKETIACNTGTVMVVENLFASVPARMKFLKKDSTEAGYVEDVLNRIALSKPEIAFKYICDGKEIFSTSGDGQLKNAILNIYGIDHAKGILEVEHTEHGITVRGVVGKAELARGNRARQTLFVNGRYIKNHVVSKVVEEAYRNVVMTGKFPFFVLDIRLAPQLVDVNVHPAKTEIKFANEKEVYDIVYHGVKNAIYQRPEIPQKEEQHTEKGQINTENYIQSRSSGKSQESVHLENVHRGMVAEFLKNTVPQRGGMPFKESESDFVFDMGQKKTQNIFPKASEYNFVGMGEKANTEIKVKKNPKGEEKEEPFDGKTAEIRIVGQVFGTYVIASRGDEMFLIDQHAAHERKRFEMLKKDYEDRGVSGQRLLAPIVLDVDGNELQIIRENKEKLEKMGFDIQEFGRNSALIHETPFISDEDEIKALALEVISIMGDSRPLGTLSFEERILDTISCKYAIKANKKLSVLEMEALASDVEEMENAGITTCPHGRPIKVRFTKREIEKMFKRIV